MDLAIGVRGGALEGERLARRDDALDGRAHPPGVLRHVLEEVVTDDLGHGLARACAVQEEDGAVDGEQDDEVRNVRQEEPQELREALGTATRGVCRDEPLELGAQPPEL